MILRNVAIIQARLGSSRFPKKMLNTLDGKPLIEWVIRRLLSCKKLDQVMLATTDVTEDDRLADIGKSLGVLVYRGSENDVLDRIVGAMNSAKADNVVRVCADNPFIDSEEVDRLVGFFANNKCDYACNHQDRLDSGYADGFGAEIISAKVLTAINEKATNPVHREHVTQYLWDHEQDYVIRALRAPSKLNFPDLCFDVNLTKDLERLRTLVRAGVNINSSAVEIVEIARSSNITFSDI